MGNDRHEKTTKIKLVDNDPLAGIETLVENQGKAKLTKRITEPHLRQHKVKGYVYYTYVRGTEKEIYLGTADKILQAVLNSKLATEKTGGSDRD